MFLSPPLMSTVKKILVLATALARDIQVRQKFPDGILWVTIGQTPKLLDLQSYIAQVLGDKQVAFAEIALGKAKLKA